MRGTQDYGGWREYGGGIIPAYAGNTKLHGLLVAEVGDHPRVCGEHRVLSLNRSVNRGSSPRMRGTRHHSRRRPVDRGIIPAYAGNTFRLPAATPARRDHPRVCGEHATGASTQVNCTGSSPRMRGTPMMRLQMAGTDGIIPAYAGNTSHRRRIGCIPRDHPRVCGEHSDSELYLSTSLGSSPRMRGTPKYGQFAIHVARIIPAYAGNTAEMVQDAQDTRDHPRVCGEHGPLS